MADLFTLNVLKMYYKFKHARLPSYVENMFENFSRHHEHETRQSLILEEPMVNTASGENCLRYILPRIVNNTNPIIINMVDSYLFEGFVRYLKNTWSSTTSIIVLFRIVIFVTIWFLNEKMVPNIRWVGTYKAPSWHPSPVTRWDLQLEDRWGVTPGCHRYSFFVLFFIFSFLLINSLAANDDGNM